MLSFWRCLSQGLLFFCLKERQWKRGFGETHAIVQIEIFPLHVVYKNGQLGLLRMEIVRSVGIWKRKFLWKNLIVINCVIEPLRGTLIRIWSVFNWLKLFYNPSVYLQISMRLIFIHNRYELAIYFRKVREKKLKTSFEDAGNSSLTKFQLFLKILRWVSSHTRKFGNSRKFFEVHILQHDQNFSFYYFFASIIVRSRCIPLNWILMLK